MIFRRPHSLFVLAVMVVIVLSGTISAARMAPDRGQAAISVMTMVYGVPVGSFCGTTSSEEHRCPFCNLLSEPPALQPDPLVSILRPHDTWRRLRGLARSVQARNINHSVRAPPAPA